MKFIIRKSIVLHRVVILLVLTMPTLRAQNHSKPVERKEARPRVVFLNPTHPKDEYWDKVTMVMSAAAKDLGIQLETVYGNDDRIQIKNMISSWAAKASPDRPDYLIIQFPMGGQDEILALLVKSNLPFVSLESITSISPSLECKDREKVGQWLANLCVNYIQKSEALIESLLKIRTQKINAKAKKISIIGISTIKNRDAIQCIEKSLKDYILQNHPDYRFEQMVDLEQDFHRAASVTKKLLERFPDTSIILTDRVAVLKEVQKVLNESHKKRDDTQTVSIGMIDQIIEGAHHLKEGDVEAIAGASFLIGACAVIGIFENYNQRQDWQKSITDQAFYSVLTIKNIDHYYPKITTFDWGQVDYRQFSAHLQGKNAKKCGKLEDYMKTLP